MASRRTVPGKSATTVDQKLLKPVKTILRFKKEDIRQCRLCMRVLPLEDVRDATATDSSASDLRGEILDAVSVKITSFDKVTSVCINCSMVVDIINDFWMTCRKADTLHGTKLLMMHPGNWLSDENKRTLTACRRLVKRNRAEMDALFKCSGLDNGDIHRLTKGKEILLEQKKNAEMNGERVNPPGRVEMVKPNEENEGSKTDEMTDSEPETSVPCGKQLDAQVEEALRQPSRVVKAWDNNHDMCELCGKLVKKIYMEQHMNVHVGHKPYECTEEGCTKRFNSSLVMNMHVRNMHTEKKQQFECEICHKLIRGAKQHKKHLETHQETNSRKVPCAVCGKTFYKSYLRDHMFVHTGEMPYECDFCDRKFAARNNWAVHRRKRHSVKDDDQDSDMLVS